MPAIIKSFKIERLFNKYNVNLEFDDIVRIFIGDNGIGKTTILKIIYYSLKCKFEKILNIDFNSIEIIFHDGEKVRVEKRDILLRLKRPLFVKKIERNFTKEEVEEVYKKLQDGNKSFKTDIFLNKLESLRITPSDFYMYYSDYRNNRKMDSIMDTISRYTGKMNIVYLPTYRRIESDSKELGLEVDLLDYKRLEHIIQFGMEDVSALFNSITGRILKDSKDKFLSVSIEILNDFIEGKKIDEVNIDELSNMNILLKRVGNENLKEKTQNRIAETKAKGKADETFKIYGYFLNKLSKIYSEQIENEENINRFVKACNEILLTKYFYYDNENVSIHLYPKTDEENKGKGMDLEKLSSGEKQWVSILAKAYLSDNDLIFIIDEPELSLSMEWQQKILPRIMDAGKCRFLLCATHSPFIFDNMYLEQAFSIKRYMEEVKNDIPAK